jgi:small subunit ribosomal protein S6
MHSYELTIILRNRDLDTLIKRVKDILAKHGTVINKEDVLGIKRMAYEIDGEREAHYTFFYIDTPPDAPKKIIAEFRLNSDILRYMFIRSQAKKTA